MTIEGSTSTLNGGFIYVEDPSEDITISVLSTSTLSGLEAYGNGAGIYLNAPDAVLTLSASVTVTDSLASGKGGFLYVE